MLYTSNGAEHRHKQLPLVFSTIADYRQFLCGLHMYHILGHYVSHTDNMYTPCSIALPLATVKHNTTYYRVGQCAIQYSTAANTRTYMLCVALFSVHFNYGNIDTVQSVICNRTILVQCYMVCQNLVIADTCVCIIYTVLESAEHSWLCQQSFLHSWLS